MGAAERARLPKPLLAKRELGWSLCGAARARRVAPCEYPVEVLRRERALEANNFILDWCLCLFDDNDWTIEKGNLF